MLGSAARRLCGRELPRMFRARRPLKQVPTSLVCQRQLMCLSS